jgi:hypothetical protein
MLLESHLSQGVGSRVYGEVGWCAGCEDEMMGLCVFVCV